VLAALGAPLGWVLLTTRFSFSPDVAATGFIAIIATQAGLMSVATWLGPNGEGFRSGGRPAAVAVALMTGGAFMFAGMIFVEHSRNGAGGEALPAGFRLGAWAGLFGAMLVFAATRKHWGKNPDGTGRWILQGLLPLASLAPLLIAGLLSASIRQPSDFHHLFFPR
jgi:hypothetical protein